jgi:hypothetical protein
MGDGAETFILKIPYLQSRWESVYLFPLLFLYHLNAVGRHAIFTIAEALRLTYSWPSGNRPALPAAPQGVGTLVQ